MVCIRLRHAWFSTGSLETIDAGTGSGIFGIGSAMGSFGAPGTGAGLAEDVAESGEDVAPDIV